MDQIMPILEQFACLIADDEVKADLELRCRLCGEHLCDVEHNDDLGVLARTALGHECDEKTLNALGGI